MHRRASPIIGHSLAVFMSEVLAFFVGGDVAKHLSSSHF
jgi:hypothetical protein